MWYWVFTILTTVTVMGVIARLCGYNKKAAELLKKHREGNFQK